MTEAISEIDIAVSADQAWELLGGFDNLSLWIPMIAQSVLQNGGRFRSLTTADGSHIVERLLTFNEEQRTYTYAYVEGPDPVQDYRGKVAVTAVSDNQCRASWSSQFNPIGLSDAEAGERYRSAYASALLHAKNLLEHKA
ncbi:SRPBCC family protein [Gluconobacter wancherniae]|uniref:SRPBCC family protein n=1 Tax=Gluconobacter wancherniae TaxID=1307955 RepID=UPI001B8C338E|nr:SRPBCC family protein [Gluconobacter wancherniae]MBS1088748.1 SRPBCC family protein [Gluconobacter wancherniae]